MTINMEASTRTKDYQERKIVRVRDIRRRSQSAHSPTDKQESNNAQEGKKTNHAETGRRHDNRLSRRQNEPAASRF